MLSILTANTNQCVGLSKMSLSDQMSLSFTMIFSLGWEVALLELGPREWRLLVQIIKSKHRATC